MSQHKRFRAEEASAIANAVLEQRRLAHEQEIERARVKRVDDLLAKIKELANDGKKYMETDYLPDKSIKEFEELGFKVTMVSHNEWDADDRCNYEVKKPTISWP